MHTTSAEGAIRQVLQKFQAGYTKRDVELVDSFMDELFLKSDATIILGTSTSELCLGFEKSKELIKSDWQYWGDFVLDAENAVISVVGSTAYFATTATVAYTFKYDEAKHADYVNFIKEQLEDAKITPKQRLTFANWVLSTAYHQRQGDGRKYLWPARLTGILVQDSGLWRFRYMQFSIPVTAEFPDERFENHGCYQEDYQKQKAHFLSAQQLGNCAEVKSLVREFADTLAKSDSVEKYLTTDAVPYMLSPDGKRHLGVEEIKAALLGFKPQGQIHLEVDEVVTANEDTLAWAVGMGIVKATVTEDELCKNEIANLLQTIGRDLPPEEKIFLLHRDISWAIKEIASGSQYSWPLRFEAIFRKENGRWLINHLNFSYPFYWILEGKVEAQRLS